MQLTKQIANSAAGQTLICLLLVGYIRLVRYTSRLQEINRAPATALLASGRPVVAVSWHGRLLMLPYAWRSRRPLYCLVSRHGDGEFLARTIERLGFRTVRGSSERADKDRQKGGAAASRQLVRLLQGGDSVALTPDGPRGPRMRAGNGVVSLARLSGVAVVPVAFSASRRRLLPTWDRFHLALPFSRIVMVYGDPIRVPRDIDETEAGIWRQRIEDALNRATADADRQVGHHPVEPAPLPVPAQEEAA